FAAFVAVDFEQERVLDRFQGRWGWWRRWFARGNYRSHDHSLDTNESFDNLLQLELGERFAVDRAFRTKTSIIRRRARHQLQPDLVDDRASSRLACCAS